MAHRASGAGGPPNTSPSRSRTSPSRTSSEPCQVVLWAAHECSKFAQCGHPRRAPSRVGQNFTTADQPLPYTSKTHLKPLDDQCSGLRCRSASDGARPSSGRGRCGANFDPQACACGQNAHHTCRNLVQHFGWRLGWARPRRPYSLSMWRFRLCARGEPRKCLCRARSSLPVRERVHGPLASHQSARVARALSARVHSALCPILWAWWHPDSSTLRSRAAEASISATIRSPRIILDL